MLSRQPTINPNPSKINKFKSINSYAYINAHVTEPASFPIYFPIHSIILLYPINILTNISTLILACILKIPADISSFLTHPDVGRAHAEVWADPKTGRVFIRDIRSSNGTFLNGQRLSQENQTSEPFELHELGIDIINEEDRSILHCKVSCCIEHAGWAEEGSSDASQTEVNPLWVDTGIAETFDTITPRVLVSNDLVHSKSVLEENKIHEYFGKEVEDILQGLNTGLKTAKQQINDIKSITKVLNNIQDTVFCNFKNNNLEKNQSEDVSENHSENFEGRNFDLHKKRAQPPSLEVLASKQLEIEEKIARIKHLEEEKMKQQTYKQIIEKLLKEENNTLEMENAIEMKMKTELMKSKSEKNQNSENELKSLKIMVETMKKEVELWKYRAKRTEKIIEQSTHHMAALLKTENQSNINEISENKLWMLFLPACCIVTIGISIMCYLNNENFSPSIYSFT
ncbi:hypothetical protein MERGE_002491 [Pneumocystis wakefieldiae]|uniref:FHA domain-containing protein n=1 Tax=Pneumocystis wakefieldiae TaxID=38082 RepID=A0A899FXJ3_9ASCO|nr:hypothetical protein MERGE_002491 [Pneumocystis wakefieldiae]